MKTLEVFYILGYNAVESKPTFRRNMTQAVTGRETCSKQSLASQFHAGFLLGLFFYRED
jgi:hypothetical protein